MKIPKLPLDLGGVLNFFLYKKERQEYMNIEKEELEMKKGLTEADIMAKNIENITKLLDLIAKHPKMKLIIMQALDPNILDSVKRLLLSEHTEQINENNDETDDQSKDENNFQEN